MPLAAAAVVGLAAGVWIDQQWLVRPEPPIQSSSVEPATRSPARAVEERPVPKPVTRSGEAEATRGTMALEEISAALKGILGEKDRYEALNRIAKAIAPNDFVLAAALANQIPHSELAWAKNLPEQIRPREMMGHLISELARVNPQLAAEFALSLPIGPARNDTVGSVAAQWASSDLAGALAWVQQMADGPAKQMALGQIAYPWAQTDPQGAAAYANQLPPGNARNNFLNSLTHSYPDAAIRWAESITNESQRHHHLQMAARQWLESDETAAHAWIAQSRLPEEWKRNLLNQRF